jgi:hypothetical protein
METHEMMKNVYGDQCMSHTCCKTGSAGLRMVSSQHDEPHLGRPSMSRDDAHVAQVHEIVCSNRRLTVREIAEECKISIGSCHDIPTTKSEMHQVVSKFVPQLLTQIRETVALPTVRNFWIAQARMKTF